MKKFLLYSSALAVLGLSGVAEAACIQTPTCSSLGYTSTSSCEGGTKCPFGNYWNCDLANKITELTNKITEIEQKVEDLETLKEVCYIGSILYSDKSCSSNLILGKTPIGVVFDRNKKLAIGLARSSEYWSPYYFDVPGVDNITDSTSVITDLDGKKNTSTILAYCKANGKSCPAFEYVNNYKTEGTNAGDWYLPSMGELYAIYGNKDVLNVALGKIVTTANLGTNYYWSSSVKSVEEAWTLYFYYGNESSNPKRNRYTVLPVLAY